MAVRRAETVYLGDASSVVKAAAAAQKANAEYAAKTKASATQIVAAQDRIAAAGNKAADAAIKAGDSQARAATLAGRAARDQAKAVGASTSQQVSAYRKASEAAIASSEKASAAQKAASDKQMAAAKASGAATLGFVKKAGEGFLAMGAASVYAAVKFQKNMELIHTQAGASTGEVTRMSKAVLQLGLTTEQGPNALVKALYPLESVGLRGATALQALTAASHGAAVGQADLTDTTHALAGVMVALHENGGQAAAQMGAIDAVVGVGKMTMQDFVDSLKSGIVPTAHAVGLSFQSMASGLATLTDAGVPAEMAATKMRTILLMLAHEHTSAAVDGLKAVGLTADQLAGAMRAPGNGLLNVLTLLHNHMDSLSKVKQVDLLSSLAGGSRSAGTLITLMQQMDRVGNKYKQIGDLTHQFNARVAAESDTASHKIKVAWSIIQTAAITFGQKLLPVISSVLTSIEKFVQGMVKGQGAGGQFKNIVVTAFNDVKSVASTVVDVVKALGSAFVTLTGPLGGLKNVIPAIVAGFVAFKAVGLIAVPLMAVARGITAVKTAGLASSLTGMISPMGLVAGAAAGLVTVMMLLRNHEESEAEAAKKVAEAKQKETEAIQAAQDAALGAADATFNQIHAAMDLKTAQGALTDAVKKYGAQSAQAKDAKLAEQEASLRLVEANHQLAGANAATTKSNKDATAAVQLRMQRDKESVQAIMQAAFQNGTSYPAALKKAKAAVQDYVSEMTKLPGVVSQAGLQQFQLQRLMNQGDLITNKNAASISQLIDVYNHVPKRVQTKLLGDSQQALATIGNLVGRLKGVVSLRTIAKILGDSSNAQQAIQGLTALLGGLPQLGRNAGIGMGQGIAAGISSQIGSIDASLNGVISSLSGILGSVVLPGPKIGKPHPAGDVTSSRSAPAPSLFPLDAALTSLNAQSAADQARFAAQDLVAQSRALHGALLGARNESRSNPSRGHDIQAAIDAIKAFNLQASRAKTLAAIDLKIKGIQQLKDYSDAIAGIRTNLTGLAQTAAQTWRTAAEAAINATHDQAIAAATAARAAAQAATDNSPDAQMLAALQATDASAADAAQTKQLNDALAAANQGVTSAQTLVAHSGGQAHVDAVAALAAAVQAAKDAQDAIDAYNRQKQETVLQANIAASNANADAIQATAVSAADASQAAALAGLDKEQADFENALNAKLQAETDNLNARKENYAQWAKDVNAILAAYGLTAPTDPSTEITITAGPGTAAAKPGKPPKKPPTHHKHPHRAMGGPVLAGVAYTVGETGPETYVPDRSGTILTAAQTRNGGGRDRPLVNIENYHSHSARETKVLAHTLAYRLGIGAQ